MNNEEIKEKQVNDFIIDNVKLFNGMGAIAAYKLLYKFLESLQSEPKELERGITITYYNEQPKENKESLSAKEFLDTTTNNIYLKLKNHNNFTYVGMIGFAEDYHKIKLTEHSKPTITDKEIKKEAKIYNSLYHRSFYDGAKWYKEQLNK